MRLLLGDCRVNRLSRVGGPGGGVALSEAGVCWESEEEEARPEER